MGAQPFGIEPVVVGTIADEIAKVAELGVQIAVVVGGGNIIRGVSAHEQGIDRITGDSMGMLATVINALALSSAIEQLGVQTRVQTAIEMNQVAEPLFAVVPSVTSKRDVSFSSREVPAIRSSPPTRRPRYGPTKSALKFS